MKDSGLFRITTYCNRLLRLDQIHDYDGAFNGLQVENDGTVSRVGAAVDASLKTIQLAVEGEIDLLLVHHGLFWSVRQPWTGTHFKILKLLLEHNLAVYSAHLPLDVHPKLGNNAQLAAALGLKHLRPFFQYRDQSLGLCTRMRVERSELVQRLQRATGRAPHLIPYGPSICRRIGVVTGGAGGELRTAAQEGMDTFVTGEGPHWTYALAEEFGINVLYGGHYATETFGVKALAEDISRKFRLPWTFLDHPTGL